MRGYKMKTYFSDVVEYANLNSELRGMFPSASPEDTIALYRRMECIAPHRLLEFADTPALNDEMILDVIDRIVI